MLTKRSRAVKIIAVNNICEKNQGRHTAGVDGICMPREKEERRLMMLNLYNSIDITTKPNPIRRVYIPKPNGDKRPLGIPTIKDRICQDIIRQSVEPIVEFHFLPCSYGFRPKRRCQDAVEKLFAKLARKQSPKWIVEGDIKGCFDHINHSHIIETLKKWGISESILKLIERMLKANIIWNGEITKSPEGTPQGGVISPMLANVALTCLDEEILNRFGQRIGTSREINPIVRYADDFIIVARSEKEAEAIKSHTKAFLKPTIGVELSDHKTHITDISDGFDFLGFNIRKYNDKLLIKPSKENVQNVKRKIKKEFRKLSHATTSALIRKLNPITKGWGNYYRHVVSKEVFTHIDRFLWLRTQRWIVRKNPLTPKKRLKRIYYRTEGKRDWVFYDKESTLSLTLLSQIPIKRYYQVKYDMRVYDANAKEYWEKREYLNAKNSIYGSRTLKMLFSEQKGKCDYCGQPMTDKQIQSMEMHKHHMKPKSEGGKVSQGNLRLLHTECHTSLHSVYSRKEMADLIDKGIDYLRLMKPPKG
jgi:RNA-directed DNA polymerase